MLLRATRFKAREYVGYRLRCTRLELHAHRQAASPALPAERESRVHPNALLVAGDTLETKDKLLTHPASSRREALNSDASKLALVCFETILTPSGALEPRSYRHQQQRDRAARQDARFPGREEPRARRCLLGSSQRPLPLAPARPGPASARCGLGVVCWRHTTSKHNLSKRNVRPNLGPALARGGGCRAKVVVRSG